MKVEPDFSDNIVVLIKNNNVYTWYVSEKELWIMDLLKLYNAFRKKRKLPLVNEIHEEGEREGYEILDCHNIGHFQTKMREYEVSYNELKEYYQLFSEVYMGGKQFRVFPSFFINFDSKIFISYFSEPGSYEDFVPDGWRGIYENEMNFDIIKEAL